MTDDQMQAKVRSIQASHPEYVNDHGQVETNLVLADNLKNLNLRLNEVIAKMASLDYLTSNIAGNVDDMRKKIGLVFDDFSGPVPFLNVRPV